MLAYNNYQRNDNSPKWTDYIQVIIGVIMLFLTLLNYFGL